MHRSRSEWQLGMPHTISGALSEVALLAHAQDLHWKEIGRLIGRPASRLTDAAGREVYASIFFADLTGHSPEGLAAFRPDDQLELVGTIGRYGASVLDGGHAFYRAGTLPETLPTTLPSAPSLRLSFVLVALGSGPDSLHVSTPSNASIERVPSLPAEPDSYRLAKAAQSAGELIAAPPNARRLWSPSYSRIYPINPDRDLNGVGLLYFAHYVAFFDTAERHALQERAGWTPESLDGRVTIRRRVAYYGNARSSDRLQIEVDALALDEPATRLLVHHRIRRMSDGRLIAVASAERWCRRPAS